MLPHELDFALLDWLARSDQIDWSRAVVDSCSIRAVYGGDQTAKRRDALRLRSTGEKPVADSAGAHGQPSLIVYTTPEHVQAPVAAAR